VSQALFTDRECWSGYPLTSFRVNILLHPERGDVWQNVKTGAGGRRLPQTHLDWNSHEMKSMQQVIAALKRWCVAAMGVRLPSIDRTVSPCVSNARNTLKIGSGLSSDLQLRPRQRISIAIIALGPEPALTIVAEASEPRHTRVAQGLKCDIVRAHLTATRRTSAHITAHLRVFRSSVNRCNMHCKA